METNKNRLINFSFFSKFLTGHRTQLTNSYDQKKYKNEVEYIQNFEKQWRSGFRYYEFYSFNENVKHNYSKNNKFCVGIKINIHTAQIIRLYVYIEKKFVFRLEEFKKINWNGKTINKVEIDFDNMSIRLY